MITAVDMRDGAGVTELAEEFGITKGAVSQVGCQAGEEGIFGQGIGPGRTGLVLLSGRRIWGIPPVRIIWLFIGTTTGFFLKYVAQLDEASYEIVRTMSRQMNLWMDNYLE